MKRKRVSIVLVFALLLNLLPINVQRTDATVKVYNVLENAVVTSSSDSKVPTYPKVCYNSSGNLQITFTGNYQRVFLKLNHIVDFSKCTRWDVQFTTSGELSMELWDRNLNSTTGEWWAGDSHEYASYGPKGGYTNITNSFPLQISTGGYVYSGQIGNTGGYCFNSMMTGNLRDIQYVSIGTNSSVQFAEGGKYTVIIRKCQIVGDYTIKQETNQNSQNGTNVTYSSDNMCLFSEASGTVKNKDIAAYFLSEWNFKSPTFPVTIKKEKKEDGSYNVKATVGIGRSDILDKETSWNQYKDTIKKYKEGKTTVKKLIKLAKESGVRSKSISVTKGMKGKPEVSVVGYYEVNYNKNGGIISQSGGAAATASWSAKKTWQRVIMAGPVPIPVYFDLTGSIDLEAQLGLDFESMQAGKFKGEITLSPSLALGGGIGASGVATFGAEGKFGVNAKWEFPSSTKGTWEASLSMKAYIVAILDWKYSLVKIPGTLWGGEKSQKRMISGLKETEGELSLVDRSYDEKTTAWNGARKKMKARTLSQYSSTTLTTLQEYIMPNTIPIIRKIGDKSVMIFQSNVSERKTADSVCLMYSIYENGEWSEPKALWDTGTTDLCPDAKVINGELHVVWQKAKEEIVDSEDATTILDDMAMKSEICYARFDTETNTFVDTTCITDDAVADMMPVLAKGDSNVTVVWIKNQDNDFFNDTGKNAIMYSSLQDKGWIQEKEVVSVKEYTGEVEAAYIGNELAVAYAATEDDADSEGEVASHIYLSYKGETKKISGENHAANIQFEDDYLYYLENNIVNEYSIMDEYTNKIAAGGETTQLYEDEETEEVSEISTSVFGSSYRVFSTNDKKAIIWSEPIEEGYAIKSSVKIDEEYSNPVVLYETEKQIQSFDAILLDDGNWQIVMNTKMVDEDGTENSALEYVSKESLPVLEVDYINVDESQRNGNMQDVLVQVSNTSEETINTISLKIFDDNSNYLEKEITQLVQPGESFIMEESIDLSAVQQVSTLRVEAIAEGQIEVTNASATTEIGKTDLSIKAEKSVAEDKKSVSFIAVVGNESNVDTNAVVSLCEKDTGVVVESKEITMLAANKTEEVVFSLDAKDIKFEDATDKNYIIRVQTENEEYNLENNLIYDVIYQDELEGVNPQCTPIVSVKPEITPTPIVTSKPTPITTLTPTPIATIKPQETPTPIASANPKETIAPTPLHEEEATKIPIVDIPTYLDNGLGNSGKKQTKTVSPVRKIKVQKLKKTKLKVTWKKVSNASGYQIQYALNRKFSKKAKKKFIGKTKYTFKKLLRNKIYYVRVRAYVLNGKKKLYGKWSKVRKVKFKK